MCHPARELFHSPKQSPVAGPLKSTESTSTSHINPLFSELKWCFHRACVTWLRSTMPDGRPRFDPIIHPTASPHSVRPSQAHSTTGGPGTVDWHVWHCVGWNDVRQNERKWCRAKQQSRDLHFLYSSAIKDQKRGSNPTFAYLLITRYNHRFELRFIISQRREFEK